MSGSFTWKRRQHPAACAANVPLLRELVLLWEDAKAAHEQAQASVAAAGGATTQKSKMQQAYGKALDSLSKYPLPISSAEEAQELQGIGAFLAARIGKLLNKLAVAPAASVHPPPTAAPPAAQSHGAAPAPKAKPRKRKQPVAQDAQMDVDDDAAGAGSSAAAANSSSAAAAATAVAHHAAIPTLPLMPSSFSPRTSMAATPLAALPHLAASSSAVHAVPAATLSPAPVASPPPPPECPYGILCYRVNPAHFVELSHPPEHPMAIHGLRASAAAARLTRPPTHRSQSDDVIVLSDSSPSPQPPSIRAPKPAHSLRAAYRCDDGDDFLSDGEEGGQGHGAMDLEDDDDDDVVDLTSPPQPKIQRAASTPAAQAPAAASASSAKSHAPLPPAHPQPTALAPLFTSNGTSAAPAAAASLPASKRAKTDKMYKPKQHSSAYALLMGLADASGPSATASLTKSQLLSAALPHFRTDKQAGGAEAADVHASLWSGMSTLVTRDLVDKALTPIVYSLTPLGRTTVQMLAPARAKVPMHSPSPDFLLSPSPSPSPDTSAASASAAAASAAPFPSASPPPVAAPLLPLRRVHASAAEFDVLLLIDIRERSGRKDAAYMSEKLGRQGIQCEARALAVGDFMWIARHKRVAGCEVVLDAMIERKRVGDLVSSVRDGRYHEQRARLKKTRLGRILYVIEGPVNQESVHGLPLATVESVLTSMNGVHGLLVHHTPTIDATISFLASLHHLVSDEATSAGVPLVLPEHMPTQPLPANLLLPSLAESPHVSPSLLGPGESMSSFGLRLHKSANLLSAELFGTQLRQIRGVSATLALSVIEHYPCARDLCDAYEKCASQEEEEAMLQHMARGAHQRSMGHAMSLKIRTFFRSTELD